jgi:hypothetical protein
MMSGRVRLVALMVTVAVAGTSVPAAGDAARTISSGLPTWTQTVRAGGFNWTFQVVGKNVTRRLRHPTTTITVPIVPVVLRFHHGGSFVTFDPRRVAAGCGAKHSALDLTVHSPLFAARNWTVGGTSVGRTQYVDAFQRAAWWQYTRPGGINPGYHVLLKPVLGPARTVTVPAARGALGGTRACRDGGIDQLWWDNYLHDRLLPRVRAANPSTFPLFIVQDVVNYLGDPSICCTFGYHYARTRGGAIQTYAWADVDLTGDYRNSAKDISVVSHELAEWINDPYDDSGTPPWGHVGQYPNLCVGHLEVADPLTGTIFKTVLRGVAYHPQDLAFWAWFYRRSASGGTHGWFSFRGTFRHAARPCA